MGGKDKKGSSWTRTKIITALCLLAIVILVITSATVRFNENAEKFEEKKVMVARKVLGRLAISKISTSEEQEFERYRAQFDEKTSWGDDAGKLILCCNYAITLVKFYNLDPDNGKSKEYLELANKVIQKINDTVFKPKKYSIIDRSANYELLSSLTILLNTFEHFADDSYKDTKILCHEQIIKMIPEFNKLHLEGAPKVDRYFHSYDSIYTISARLLTNVLYNKEFYNHDINKMNVIKVLEERFDSLAKNPEEKKYFLSYPYYYNIYEAFKGSH